MNKKMWIVSSIILFVLLLISVSILIYIINDNKESIDSYTCTDNVTRGEVYYQFSNQETFDIDLTGAVTNAASKLIYTYTAKDAYLSAKTSFMEKEDKDSTYEYNDDAYVIKITSSGVLATVKDETGEVQEMWYKSYIKLLEGYDYTCVKNK